jgi:hypothetical protein
LFPILSARASQNVNHMHVIFNIADLRWSQADSQQGA